MRHKGNTITYLRLPPRTAIDKHRNIADIVLPYAIALRGKLLQTGVTSLAQPGFVLGDAYTVVLLIAASDVTLLRVDVPPLPAHRLHGVLPALVEDRLIGDAADCLMVAGKELAGKRAVAVMQRDWLLAWTRQLHQSGVHRIRALPLQLCLPLQADHLAAALMVNGDVTELVIRYAADEGIGLPMTDADEVTLPDQVLQLLSTMAGERVTDLFLPPDVVGEYQSALASGHHSVKPGVLHELTCWYKCSARSPHHASVQVKPHRQIFWHWLPHSVMHGQACKRKPVWVRRRSLQSRIASRCWRFVSSQRSIYPSRLPSLCSPRTHYRPVR